MKSVSAPLLPPSRRLAMIAAVASTLALPACKKDKNADLDADRARAQEGMAAPPTAQASSRPVVPATRLAGRDAVLGHVLVPNGSQFLSEVKAQLAVGQVTPFVDEGFLRGMLAGQLGKRSGLAQNVELAQPIGCAVLSPKAFEMPAACHLNYKGGLEQLVKDLGDDGKQADAAGHAAHYVIDGQSLFVDSLGDALVVSGHADVFGKAKGYLEANLMGRAPRVASDIELVVYAGAILEQYREDLDPVLETVTDPPPPDKAGDPKLDKVMRALTDYNAKSTRDTIQRISEMEQVTVGLGLERLGFVARFAMFPTEGSRLQKEAVATAGPPLDQALLGRLPASAWCAGGGSYNREAMWNTQSTAEVVALLSRSYSELAGRDPAQVEATVNAFAKETNQLYASDIAFALAHEPETVGGLVVVQPLKPGQSARSSWHAFANRFTPPNVLPKAYRNHVTWSFTADVATVEGVPVDRWTIEPTGKLLDQLNEEMTRDDDLAAWESKLGGFRLVVDRAETDSRVTFVIAPNAEATYMKAALVAQQGSGGLVGEPGLAKVGQRQPSVTGLFAANVKKGAAWIRSLLPPKKAAELPDDLGTDLSDMFLTISTSDTGLSTGEFVISQPLMDQIRKVAEKSQ